MQFAIESVLFGQAEAVARPEGLPGLLAGPLLPMMVVGLLFYFMVLRPEKNKSNNHAELISNLKKNDRIVTIGGIYGTIVNAQKGVDEVAIKIDENSNTKIRILRSAVSRVITDDESSKEK
jgi:preprotein translocase subunit YajC